jgi:hypothetical protein
MNVYLVTYVSGENAELEADYYLQEGEAWIFFRAVDEVLRVEIEKVAGVTKAR